MAPQDSVYGHNTTCQNTLLRFTLQPFAVRVQSGSVGLSRARYSLFDLGNPAPLRPYWLTTMALTSPPASTVGPKQEQMVQTCAAICTTSNAIFEGGSARKRSLYVMNVLEHALLWGLQRHDVFK